MARCATAPAPKIPVSSSQLSPCAVAPAPRVSRIALASRSKRLRTCLLSGTHTDLGRLCAQRAHGVHSSRRMRAAIRRGRRGPKKGPQAGPKSVPHNGSTNGWWNRNRGQILASIEGHFFDASKLPPHRGGHASSAERVQSLNPIMMMPTSSVSRYSSDP